MKKVHIITGVLAAALIAASFAGCGEKAETQDVSTAKQEQSQDQSKPQEQSQDQSKPQEHNGTMAKVVSLSGDQLTVVLADRPDNGNPQAPQTEGVEPASGPAIDGSGAPADGPGQPGQGGGKIEFTGEQVTYTLSGDVAVMKGEGDNATKMNLSELKADDVIRFTTVTDDSGSETIDSIIIME